MIFTFTKITFFNKNSVLITGTKVICYNNNTKTTQLKTPYNTHDISMYPRDNILIQYIARAFIVFINKRRLCDLIN